MTEIRQQRETRKEGKNNPVTVKVTTYTEAGRAFPKLEVVDYQEPRIEENQMLIGDDSKSVQDVRLRLTCKMSDGTILWLTQVSHPRVAAVEQNIALHAHRTIPSLMGGPIRMQEKDPLTNLCKLAEQMIADSHVGTGTKHKTQPAPVPRIVTAEQDEQPTAPSTPKLIRGSAASASLSRFDGQ